MFSTMSFSAHRQWTVSRWVQPLLDAPASDIADGAVMTLGLAGEIAEVAAVVEDWASGGICDTANLVKELGDTIFYWSRVCARFELDFPDSDSFAPAVDVSCKGCPALGAPVLPVLRMVRAAGLVTETVKKYFRDGQLKREQLAQGMTQVLHAWIEVCAASGLNPQDVIRSNHDKVEGRVARGTQRGSGDHR